MALYYSGCEYELREVLLKNKPAPMLSVSSKGTVPVLLLENQVIDESIEVMEWALSQSDPLGWGCSGLEHELVKQNDNEFKGLLDRYKYFDRHPGQTQTEYFRQACDFLQRLENNMVADDRGEYWLVTPRLSTIDVAIFPFIRQFAMVDRKAFDDLPFRMLQSWLNIILESELFNAVMHKHPVWAEGQRPVYSGVKMV